MTGFIVLGMHPDVLLKDPALMKRILAGPSTSLEDLRAQLAEARRLTRLRNSRRRDVQAAPSAPAKKDYGFTALMGAKLQAYFEGEKYGEAFNRDALRFAEACGAQVQLADHDSLQQHAKPGVEIQGWSLLGTDLIVVSDRLGPADRDFTICHEVAHFFYADSGFDGADQEAICDAFAQGFTGRSS